MYVQCNIRVHAFFEIYHISQLFYFLCSQILSVFQCLFWYVTQLYKKILTCPGDPKLWSQNIQEIYDSEGKKFKQFWNPLAKGYEMSTEMKFSEKVLHPNVHTEFHVYLYLFVFSSKYECTLPKEGGKSIFYQNFIINKNILSHCNQLFLDVIFYN